MKPALYACAAFALASLALPASAQSMKPGLWELNNNVGSGNGGIQAAMAEMRKQMAAMAPDQRQALEQALAGQGVQLNLAPGGGIVTKVCVTPEMAKRADLPMQQQGDCTYSRSPAVGGKVKFSFACNNPRTTGDGEVAFTSDTSYTMKARIVPGSGGGEVVTMDSSAQWLGGDCGGIKPLMMPRSK
jgi:hypothetical protein